MADTSSAWKSRANVPQGDPTIIHLHKELHDHGQAIAELTTTMNQLANAQLQQVQAPRQVNGMESINILVNKRRQRGQQSQGSPGQYDQVELQEDDIPLVVENVNDDNLNEEVRIDIQGNEVETQEDMNPSREHIIDIPETVVPKAKAPLPRPPPPYTQRLAKQKNENQFKKFIDMIKSLSINVPLVEALEQMPDYSMFMKDLVTKKRSMECESIKMTHQVSAIVHLMAPNLEDTDAFTISCNIGSANFAKALCDLGTSINLMHYSVFKTLGIRQPRATSMILQMEDRTMKRSLGIIYDPNSKEVCSFVDLVTEVIVDDTSAMINVEDPLEAVLLNLDVNEDEGRGVVCKCFTWYGVFFL
uniref:Uncharacterized protein n=1 Tax=Nicotiana tabacum TaxID=4097 RepID=A0A1S4AC38_TOBAC|nr:PREDICTED: uncharacterized protein LOC107796032 [Nicotiana tabacum]